MTKKLTVSMPLFEVEETAAQSEEATVQGEPHPVRETVSAEPSPVCVAVTELLAFNPRFIPQLPLPTTLLCRRQDGGGLMVATTSRAAYEAARAAGVTVFAGGEFLAMVVAAENERGTPAELARWCKRKAAEPAWRLTQDAAMSGVEPDATAPQWLLGGVLWTLGAELLAVGVGDELPRVEEVLPARAG